MDDPDAIHTGLRSRQVERLRDVGRLHRRPERPRDDVARVVIQHRGQVVPAPADDVQIGEVGLPQLVGPTRRVLNLDCDGASS